MIDLPEKTRHAVEMAAAARALAGAAPTDHRKRVLARYAFVYLHDVVRFAPAWRNALARDPQSQATAEAAKPALDRLRRDWETYADIRHYLAAKRQPRDPGDKAADQLADFRLWADIGDLSVETLTDDAVDIYAQLAALDGPAPIDARPAAPEGIHKALAGLDPIGTEAFLEATTSSFGAAKPNAVPIRMGGEVGGLVPLINDVADSATTLRALLPAVSEQQPFRRLVTCQLPSELNELLRLTIGPPSPVQKHAGDTESLLGLYKRADRSPDARRALEELRESIAEQTLEELLDWRNRVGAHIDADCPWDLLDEGMWELRLDDCVRLLEHVELSLEIAACSPGGPVLLLMNGRHFKSLMPASGYEGGLPYGDADASTDPGSLLSALPPPEVDSDYVIWTAGPRGSILSAAVAGMIAGRARQLRERLGVSGQAETSGSTQSKSSVEP